MMKKLTATGLALIIIIAIAFYLFSINSQYNGERALWKASHQLAKVLQNPESTPDIAYTKLVKRYSRIIKKFSSYPSVMANAYFQLSQVYVAKKDYETARKTLQKIFIVFPKNKILQSEASFAIAQTFEKENNWDEVEKIYKKIIKDYPLTPVGIQMPLILARFYRVIKQDETASQMAYQQAEKHYRQLMQKYPNTPAAFGALNLIVSIKVENQKWQDAFNTLKDLALKFPNNPNLLKVFQSINAIAIMKLQDPVQARQVYEEFLRKNPRHPLKAAIQEMITGLKKVEEKKAEKENTKNP